MANEFESGCKGIGGHQKHQAKRDSSRHVTDTSPTHFPKPFHSSPFASFSSYTRIGSLSDSYPKSVPNDSDYELVEASLDFRTVTVIKDFDFKREINLSRFISFGVKRFNAKSR